jgi:transposase
MSVRSIFVSRALYTNFEEGGCLTYIGREGREGMLDEGQMREFLETWQTKRDGTMRGIVEVKP